MEKLTILLLPQNRILTATPGMRLQDLLRREGIFLDAPCGGNGTCGKCTVLVDGAPVKACSYTLEKNISVTLPENAALQILSHTHRLTPQPDGYSAAVDIGTTGVVCALLSPAGQELATASCRNPQAAYGADVVSRIQAAAKGEDLTGMIRQCVSDLIAACCQSAGVAAENIRTVSIVGNSCMQQLFLGMGVENLSTVPFLPAITQTLVTEARTYLPLCPNATLLTPPDIAGFVGGDTVGCILAAELYKAKDTVLLVDIGTNGEMVLCHKGRLLACATAAGPALEGANISCGMRAEPGAIDHVSPRGCTVIGDRAAAGICGSGLIDAVSVMLCKGLLNSRGRILNETHTYPLTDAVSLTQEDIRQVQLAKGAIAAGIDLLTQAMGIGVQDIDRCLLAGAFGAYLDPASACRIGLLPEELSGRIHAAGNLALGGAKLLSDPACLSCLPSIVSKTEYLELSTLPTFRRTFARCMTFREDSLLVKARECGFTEAVWLNVDTLEPMEMVRQACAADKCSAYGKNWTCPPHCGTLEQCAAKIKSYPRGLLLQTVGKLEKAIDTKGYARAEKAHLDAFHKLADYIRQAYPDALCLGAGGCRICQSCAWPAPCRFPDKACASMEGYGLFVSRVCRDNGLAYHHGEKTITYSACILFSY